jgi:S-phase kinase-associated protein 1
MSAPSGKDEKDEKGGPTSLVVHNPFSLEETTEVDEDEDIQQAMAASLRSVSSGASSGSSSSAPAMKPKQESKGKKEEEEEEAFSLDVDEKLEKEIEEKEKEEKEKEEDKCKNKTLTDEDKQDLIKFYLIERKTEFNVIKKFVLAGGENSLWRTTLESRGEDEEHAPIPVIDDYLSKETMLLILRFLEEHFHRPYEDPVQPLKTNDIAELFSDPEAHFKCDNNWYVKFALEDLKTNDTLHDVLFSANQLGIDPLVEFCTTIAAARMKGKTPEQIREEFEILNDFEDELEVHEVKVDYLWTYSESEQEAIKARHAELKKLKSEGKLPKFTATSAPKSKEEVEVFASGAAFKMEEGEDE